MSNTLWKPLTPPAIALLTQTYNFYSILGCTFWFQTKQNFSLSRWHSYFSICKKVNPWEHQGTADALSSIKIHHLCQIPYFPYSWSPRANIAWLDNWQIYFFLWFFDCRTPQSKNSLGAAWGQLNRPGVISCAFYHSSVGNQRPNLAENGDLESLFLRISLEMYLLLLTIWECLPVGQTSYMTGSPYTWSTYISISKSKWLRLLIQVFLCVALISSFCLAMSARGWLAICKHRCVWRILLSTFLKWSIKIIKRFELN